MYQPFETTTLSSREIRQAFRKECVLCLSLKFSFRFLVDSGADFCVFPATFGELIEIDVKKGREIISFGVGGKETLYFHQVKVGIIVRSEVWRFQCLAGFSYKMNPKGTGLLGRNGFFDLFEEVSFNQNKQMFRLKGEGTRPFEDLETV